MTTLYLVRHGETDNNLQGCFNGSKSNQPLNEKGRAQSLCLAAPFAAIAPDAVYASPLRRAIDTAMGLCAELDVTPAAIETLRELDMGAYDGVSFQRVREIDPYIMENWNRADVQMPGGECFSQAQARVSNALSALVAENRGKTLAVVAHGTLIQLFLMRIWQIAWQDKITLPILRNTGYVALQIEDDGHFTTLCYDEVGHLSQDLLPVGKIEPRKKTARPGVGPTFVGQTLYFEGFAR